MKNYKKRKKGNALIEFAMVFPLLAVFTMGSIWLSIAFAQKSMMNGFAFYEARAASVRNDAQNIHEDVLARYKKDSNGKQPWLEKAESNIKVSNNQIEVEITKEPLRMDMLYNCLALLGGKKSADIKQIKSNMYIPYEYVKHKNSPSDRPQTYNVVDYEAEYTFESYLKDKMSVLPQGIQKWINETIFNKMVDPKSDNNLEDNDNKLRNKILGTDQVFNMKKLKTQLEDNFNIEYKEVTYGGGNSATNEKPKDISFDDIGKDPLKIARSMNFLEATGNHIAAIETGKIALIVIKDSLPAAKPLGAVMDIVGQAGETVAPVLDTLSEDVSLLNTKLYRESVISK